jgi:hypothetical protein
VIWLETVVPNEVTVPHIDASTGVQSSGFGGKIGCPPGATLGCHLLVTQQGEVRTGKEETKYSRDLRPWREFALKVKPGGSVIRSKGNLPLQQINNHPVSRR